ncbi:MAG: hypothetical protein A2W85_14320 [Bacteroidetes bacterium GWF2_41_31]|nr:MAG: hypothetical protein A2W85_14320 [Bacteroidetes bacterium GWF2_41_31]OFZ03568.1 MAG: hypothetical protein A2338_09230 [Bacteroidetes bacterium RIFOXYB12_FULL_41_6]
MSEFCSQCSPNFTVDDINLFEIATNLKPGQSESFNCQGCNNRTLFKDEDGNIYLGKLIDGIGKLLPVKIEELKRV